MVIKKTALFPTFIIIIFLKEREKILKEWERSVRDRKDCLCTQLIHPINFQIINTNTQKKKKGYEV